MYGTQKPNSGSRNGNPDCEREPKNGNGIVGTDRGTDAENERESDEIGGGHSEDKRRANPDQGSDSELLKNFGHDGAAMVDHFRCDYFCRTIGANCSA